MVDQQDGVVHHDATHHDDPDIGLACETCTRVEEHQEHAHQRHRHGEQHTDGLPQGLEQRGRHHEDQHERDAEHDVDLCLLFVRPGPGLLSLDAISVWEFGGRNDSVTVAVAQLARPAELVPHRALVLLIHPLNHVEHIPFRNLGDVGQTDVTAGRSDQGLGQFEDVEIPISRHLQLEAQLLTADANLPLARAAADGDLYLTHHVAS